MLEILRATGALLEGHFRLTSGRHSDRFFLMPHTFQHPGETERLCRELASRFQEDQVETVWSGRPPAVSSWPTRWPAS